MNTCSLKELITSLKQVVPVSYLAFPDEEVPDMPFVVYQSLGSDNTGADNVVWHKATRYQFDLLCSRNADAETATRNRAVQKDLEDTFEQHGIFWEREDGYDDDEVTTRLTYVIEL